jgi:integrase/predicted transcriptional regulator
MIRIPTHIQKSRHGIYFFRIVVPSALREALDGRGEIKKSLRTRDLRVAMRMARPLALNAYELFDRVERAMSEPTPESILANLDAVRELKKSGSVTLPDGTTHSFEVEENDTANPAKMAAFREVVSESKQELADAVARYREKPVEVSDAMRDYQAREAKEMAAFKAGLPNANASGSLAKAETAEAPASFKSDPQNMMSQRWPEYVAQTEGNTWTAGRTSKAAKAKFEEFRAWLGEDIDVRAIDRPLISLFKDHLTRQRVIESGARKGEKGLNVRTVDNYTSAISAFLKWCQDAGHFPDDRRLPTEGQTIVKKAARVRRQEKANPPYAINQLVKLFDAKHFNPGLAHHFWPPLIALFTGARRREIAQLLVHDFRVIDGIPSVSIDILGDEDKSLKSPAAKRVIPVHPELIRIGLLRYVEDARAQGLGPELFPGIGTDGNGEKGNAIGNAWRRHREKHGLAGPRAPTFHSFRTTALQELKRNGVGIEMRSQLAGHEFDHASKSYDPNPFSVAQLMELGIPKFKYEGLDLSKLAYVERQFEKSNAEGAVKVESSEKHIAAKKARKAVQVKTSDGA